MQDPPEEKTGRKSPQAGSLDQEALQRLFVVERLSRPGRSADIFTFSELMLRENLHEFTEWIEARLNGDVCDY